MVYISFCERSFRFIPLQNQNNSLYRNGGVLKLGVPPNLFWSYTTNIVKTYISIYCVLHTIIQLQMYISLISWLIIHTIYGLWYIHMFVDIYAMYSSVFSYIHTCHLWLILHAIYGFYIQVDSMYNHYHYI